MFCRCSAFELENKSENNKGILGQEAPSLTLEEKKPNYNIG